MPRIAFKANSEAIIERRRLLNLTQESLAQQSGLGKRTIERLEKSGTANATTFMLLARVLKCDATKLQEAVPIDPEKLRRQLHDQATRINEENQSAVKVVSKRLQKRLAKLVYPLEAEGGYLLECRLRTDSLQFRVKKGVSLGLLANLIGYARAKRSANNLTYFFSVNSNGDRLPNNITTIDHLAAADIHTVSLFQQEVTVSVMHSVFASRSTPLRTQFTRFHGTGYNMTKRLCRAAVWLLSRSWLLWCAPPKLFYAIMNNYAYYCAECNVNIPEALRVTEVMERSSRLTRRSDCLDTVMWVLYRAGAYQTAYALSQAMPPEALSQPVILYHLYFITMKVGDARTAQLIRDVLALLAPEFDWSSPVPPAEIVTEDWDLLLYEIVYTRVRMDDDLAQDVIVRSE